MSSSTGHVTALHRYPIKSMQGEAIDESWAGERGLLGDRGWGVVDVVTGKIASAKHPRLWRRLLECRARYAEPPRPDRPLPPVQIEFPDGTQRSTEDPTTSAALSELLGRRVELAQSAPRAAAYEDYWPDIEHLSPEGYRDQVTELPVALLAPEGTFFDLSAFHVITTQSMAALSAAAPASRIESARLRPNLELCWDDESPAFLENAWPGRNLRVGEGGVVMKVLMPSMRCVMTTLPQGDLPEDHGVLRALVQANRIDIPRLGKYPCIGAYASLSRKLSSGGLLRRGDACRLEG
jgi:uncharacterized protein